jgi:hypothetical protein
MTSHSLVAPVTGISALVAEAHRIATGHAVSLRAANRYFRDPKELTRAIRGSGALRDPKRVARLRELLADCDGEERNGI